MENMEFDKISFDYYNNAPSYIKMIVDMLPESKLSNEKRVIIRDLYNYYLATSNDAKINEIIKVSRLFREKISLSDLNSIAKQVDYIYATFFNKIIFDSINRQAVFDIMTGCVGVYSGFYDEYSKDMYSSSNVELSSSVNR